MLSRYNTWHCHLDFDRFKPIKNDFDLLHQVPMP